MVEGRPGSERPHAFPVHDYGEYGRPGYGAYDDPPDPDDLGEPVPRRHAAPATPNALLNRRNALLGTALVAAGGGTAYLMRNVGHHTGAPVANVPGVALPEGPVMPAGLPGRAPGTGQPGSGRPGASRPATGTRAMDPDAHAAGSSGLPGPATLHRSLDPELLLRRTTYGPTGALRATLRAAGMDAWLNAQLAPARLADPGGAAVSRMFPRLAMSADAVHRQFADNDQWTVMTDLVSAHIGRAVWSERQLFEVLVDFWSNHLNVTCPSGDVWDTRHRYDADVIRRFALGRFADLLAASAFHPSMLVYLDAFESTRQAPNENYARELMELHTVGIDGGYTETDVKHAALLLTGWRVEDGRASFDPDRHFVGPVRVMAFSHPNGAGAGLAAQRAFLAWLARRPATARRLATKLAVRFVGDAPPAALVSRLATAYLRNDTAIVPVLRALFASPEFADSAGAKVRRPFEQLVATARAIGVRPGSDPQGLTQFYWMLGATGHLPLGWGPPDGNPDKAAAWQSPAAALSVFNTTASLVHGWYPDKLTLPGAEGLLARPPATRAAAIDAVARQVLGRGPTAAERSAAATLLAGTRLPTGLRAGSWEQQETVALTALLFLSSPAHLTR